MTDHLSPLPDEIILKILSFLPIKTSASLSVLSRRFRNLPSLLPSQRILVVDDVTPHPFPNALLRRLEIADLHHLSLDQTRSIIVSASSLGLRELSLGNSFSSKSFVPNLLFDIKSLQTFSATNCRISPAPLIQSTNLRTIKLCNSRISDDVIHDLVSACRSLEKLHLIKCIGCDRLVVGSDSLKHLWLDSAMPVKLINVCAAGLVTLTVYTRPELEELRIEAPEVRKAYLHLSDMKGRVQNVFRKFLSKAKMLESLKLRGSSVQLLAKEFANLGRLNILFKKLRILSVSLDFTSEQQALFLLELLESCPYLVQLFVSISQARNERPKAIYEGFTDRIKLLKCLPYHLVDAEVHGFKAGLIDQEFVRVLLSEAKSIKKMLLQFPSSRSNAVKNMLSAMDRPTNIVSLHRQSCRIVLEF